MLVGGKGSERYLATHTHVCITFTYGEIRLVRKLQQFNGVTVYHDPVSICDLLALEREGRRPNAPPTASPLPCWPILR